MSTLTGLEIYWGRGGLCLSSSSSGPVEVPLLGRQVTAAHVPLSELGSPPTHPARATHRLAMSGHSRSACSLPSGRAGLQVFGKHTRVM